MALTPWDRAKSGTDHGEQSALFMWCNMAALFGVRAANDPASYSVAQHAQSTYGHKPSGGICQTGGPEAVPILSRLYAIKNQGHGDKIRGNLSKAEGVKAGVPDVLFPMMRRAQDLDQAVFGALVMPFNDGGYGFGVIGGLYIELKRRKSSRGAAGRTSEAQEEDWIPYLRRSGYATAVCVGWEEARDMLLRYIGHPLDGL